MKRAEVCKTGNTWTVDLFEDGPAPERAIPIQNRPFGDEWTECPTHAAALAHALAEVGLTEKNTEKEENR